ncbi:hypothetical protein JY651_36455 [Pyxidicoccus parkwayensis]|uniref:Lysozyme inhibitor LprI N-terminal domain-containing protein n=1 Tax=Pyxidicoccus parkwayensis TaxID=2813578 RepID=A0ABX7NPR2_9BACT|nr:hypothetical protein [Pyxidicoccus parkwaysis]QSQ20688.1 hypothetical protein JY651_36455 [Pyxidicoccus parkwaysis]
MNPLFLILPLALHAAPEPDAPVSAYLEAACAEEVRAKGPQDPDAEPTTADMRNAEDARVACSKKAMEKELDAFLVPLKKKDPAAFKAWMALQADYNRWTSASCDIDERLSGEGGSMAGFTEMACAQRARSHRAWFAKQLASGDLKPFWTVVDAMQSKGKAGVQEVAKQLAEDPDLKKALEAKLKETNATTEKLAAGHCKALAGAPSDCAAKLAAYFHAVGV